ncbi:MAG: glutaminase [Butyricimonas faecihominis]
MDYKEVIDNIYNEVKPLFGQGKVADYIPALANINPRQYGIAIATLDGQIVGTGDYQTKFSIQSISKVFTLAMVVRHMGDLWKYVGREPSGTPLTRWFSWNTNRNPRNPFINAGALVVTDKVMNLYHHRKKPSCNS